MTTCILSRQGFGCADTRGTMGNMPLPAIHRKIFAIDDPLTNRPHTLVAFSGLLGLEQRCRPLRQPLDKLTPSHLHPASSPESTIDWLYEYQYEKRNDEEEKRTLLVTNTKRQLILIDSAGSMTELDENIPFWAVGSGQAWSLGYLQGLRETLSDEKIGIAEFGRAISYASYYDTWTGPDSISVQLNGESGCGRDAT